MSSPQVNPSIVARANGLTGATVVPPAALPDQTVFVHRSLTATASSGIWNQSQSTNAGGVNLLRGLEDFQFSAQNKYVLDNLNGTNLTFYPIYGSMTNLSKAFCELEVRDGAIIIAAAPMADMVFINGNATNTGSSALEVDRLRITGRGLQLDGRNVATTCFRTENAQYIDVSGVVVANATNGLVITNCNNSVFCRPCTHYNGPGLPYGGTSVDVGLICTGSSTPNVNGIGNVVYSTRFVDPIISLCGKTGAILTGESIIFEGGFISVNGQRDTGAPSSSTANVAFVNYSLAGHVTNTISSRIQFIGTDMEVSGTNTLAVWTGTNGLTQSKFEGIDSFAAIDFGTNCTLNQIIGGNWSSITDAGTANSYKYGTTSVLAGSGTTSADIDFTVAAVRVVQSQAVIANMTARQYAAYLGATFWTRNDPGGVNLNVQNYGSIGSAYSGTASTTGMTSADGTLYNGSNKVTFPVHASMAPGSNGAILIAFRTASTATQFLANMDDVGSHRCYGIDVEQSSGHGIVSAYFFVNNNANGPFNASASVGGTAAVNVTDGKQHVVTYWMDGTHAYSLLDNDLANNQTYTLTTPGAVTASTAINLYLGDRPAAAGPLTGAIECYAVFTTMPTINQVSALQAKILAGNIG